MRFRTHPTCWTNILERKISISIKFERLNVRMPIQIYCSFRHLFLPFYKMDSQRGETVEQTKETIKNGKKKWTDDKVQDLIELLEEKPCLWDIFSNEYTKREMKERAYAELAKHSDSSSAIVKAKILVGSWSRNGKRIGNKKCSGNRRKVR